MSLPLPLRDHLARLARALGAPVRIAILDALAQAPRGVEQLAALLSQSVANTSQHLRILREARLVEGRRDGVHITYRLTDPRAATLLVALRELGESQLAELRAARDALLASTADVAHIDRSTLRRRLDAGEVVLIDVRPSDEFAAGHLPGALSIPLPELEAALDSLPKKLEVVAYCRGPYCMLAVEAVRALEKHGRRARRFEDGVAEWTAAGLPLAHGTTPPPSRRTRRKDSRRHAHSVRPQ